MWWINWISNQGLGKEEKMPLNTKHTKILQKGHNIFPFHFEAIIFRLFWHFQWQRFVHFHSIQKVTIKLFLFGRELNEFFASQFAELSKYYMQWLATLLECVNNKNITVNLQILFFIFFWVNLCIKVGESYDYIIE